LLRWDPAGAGSNGTERMAEIVPQLGSRVLTTSQEGSNSLERCKRLATGGQIANCISNPDRAIWQRVRTQPVGPAEIGVKKRAGAGQQASRFRAACLRSCTAIVTAAATITTTRAMGKVRLIRMNCGQKGNDGTPGRHSFMPQGCHRVDLGGAPRGQASSQYRSQQEDHHRQAQRRGIIGLHPKQ
jgi:hypothetical protein